MRPYLERRSGQEEAPGVGPDPVGLGLFQEGVTGHRGRPAWWERMRGGGQGRCTWRWRIGDAQLQARGWEVTRAKRGHGLPAPSQPQWGPARRQVTSTTAAEGERRQSCNRVPRPAGSSPARGAGFPALGSPASSALCGRSSSREDLTRSGGPVALTHQPPTATAQVQPRPAESCPCVSCCHASRTERAALSTRFLLRTCSSLGIGGAAGGHREPEPRRLEAGAPSPRGNPPCSGAAPRVAGSHQLPASGQPAGRGALRACAGTQRAGQPGFRAERQPGDKRELRIHLSYSQRKFKMILHLKNTPFSQDVGTLGWRTVSGRTVNPPRPAAFVRAAPLVLRVPTPCRWRSCAEALHRADRAAGQRHLPGGYLSRSGRLAEPGGSFCLIPLI